MKQMKRLLSLLLVLCMVASFALPASAAAVSVAGGATMEQLTATIDGTEMAYWLYTPANATGNMPLITFLHGGGGRSITTAELVQSSYVNLPYYLYSGQVSVNAYVLIPHITGSANWDFETVKALTNQIITEKKIDSEKVSLTGHSFGGAATWTFALADKGSIFKRYAPLSSSVINTSTTNNVNTLAGLSIRMAYGGAESTDMSGIYTAVKNADSNADIAYIVVDGAAHADVVQVYKNNTAIGGDNIMDWLSFADSTSGDSGSGGTGEEEDDTTGGDSGNTSGTVTYKYASTSTPGEQYILVSNGYAIQNNGGTIAAVEVTVSGDYVTFDSSIDASTLLWTIDEDGNLCNVYNNTTYYLLRQRSTTTTLVLATSTTRYLTGWTYSNDDLSVTTTLNNGNTLTYYANYSDGAFVGVNDAASTSELKFYGIETSGGGTTDPSEPEVTLDYITVSGDRTYGVGGVLALKVTAHYTDGTTADVTESATISGYDMNTVGEQTVSVSYTEDGVTQTAGYNIVVTDSDAGELFVDKHATLENDGSYTIKLEAYSTGTPVITNEPADICLILDVSGSMYQEFVPEYKESNMRIFETMYGYATPNAETGNIRATYYHQCVAPTTDEEGNAIAGVYCETEWSVSGDYYTWTCTGCGEWETNTANVIPTTQLYLVDTPTTQSTTCKMAGLKDAVTEFIKKVQGKNAGITDTSLWTKMAIVKFSNTASVVNELQVVNAENADAMCDSIGALTCTGSTNTSNAMTLAAQQMESSDRQKIYIVFTDGNPTGDAQGTAFNEDCANAAVQAALAEKQAGAIIYTIAIVDGADPADISKETINLFMNAMSSNYPNATAWNNLGSGNNYGYYMAAQDADELISLYDFISKTTIAATVELDKDSQLIDYLNTGFVLNDSCTVTVETAAYLGKDTDGNRLWDKPAVLEDAAVSDDKSTGAVTVSNFAYDEECVADATSDTQIQGSKLIVTIRGVEATDAVIASGVMTNKNTSGIYDGGNMVDDFPKPTTTLTKATYVLDYAKTAKLAMEDFLQTRVNHLDVYGMNQFSDAVTELEHKYGDVSAAEDKLTYTPDTMQWDGYDTFYAFGKTGDTEVQKQEANGVYNNIWSKISVLPANNVYYEDTFVTENEQGGRVGIVYTGKFETVTEGDNTETPETGENGDNHGWIDALDGELKDTDGTATGATVSSDTTATATFTFTGTGVDIYSRTTPTTGTILVTIKGTAEDGTSVAKAKVIDTVSYSGDYYQVPTCTFDSNDGLSYGTYTVTINVTAAAASENRFTYYLDGIRVYNPLSNDQQIADSTVQDAYGDEVNAYFEEIRNDLIDQSSDEELTGGAVFIDKADNGTGVTSAEVGIYEDFGPKNEVYLKTNQMIVMNVTYTEGVKYYVGMKLLNGGSADSVTAGILQSENTNATVVIDHSADMYYEVTPVSDGNGNYTITIQNMSEGSALLSITKLKVTNVPGAAAAPVSFMMDISTEDALAVANLAYSAPVADTEIPAEPEEDVTEPTEPETEPTEPETPEVEIVNPGIDEETLKQIQNAIEEQAKQLEQLVNKLFGAFSKWFS